MSWLGRSNGEVLRGDFRAGEGNQILVFQKVLCLALSLGSKIVTPTLFHCDRTAVPDDCNASATFPMQDVLVLSNRAKRASRLKKATRVINNAYYMVDKCAPKIAFDFMDVLDVTDKVKVYGEMLKRQCPSPCAVVQHRVGKDWVPHAAAFPGAAVGVSMLQRSMKQFPDHNFLALTPERTSGHLPCPRVRHSNKTHPTVRFLGEIYVASRANVFLYNSHSTTHHLVRRLAQHTLKLVSLKAH